MKVAIVSAAVSGAERAMRGRDTPRRRLWVVVAVAVAVAQFGVLAPSGEAETFSCPQGAVLDIVAHEDDDLLFLSPDVLHDIAAGRCVQTVFVTAGDANLGMGYAMPAGVGDQGRVCADGRGRGLVDGG